MSLMPWETSAFHFPHHTNPNSPSTFSIVFLSSQTLSMLRRSSIFSHSSYKLCDVVFCKYTLGLCPTRKGTKYQKWNVEPWRYFDRAHHPIKIAEPYHKTPNKDKFPYHFLWEAIVVDLCLWINPNVFQDRQGQKWYHLVILWSHVLRTFKRM